MKLFVSVVEGKFFPKVQGENCNIICELSTSPNSQIQKTEGIDDINNPIWEEEFEFDIKNHNHATLHISIKN